MNYPQARTRKLSEIEGLEDYSSYLVDVDGNVWSIKYNKFKQLKPGWGKKQNGYLFVRLSSDSGVKKNFYVHRLVAMAFLPNDDFTLQVNHINRNSYDNRLENLEWCSRKQNIDHNSNVDAFMLDSFLTNKIKKVHAASIRKGLPVPDGYSFMNSMIDGALEQFINEYGLRKVM